MHVRLWDFWKGQAGSIQREELSIRLENYAKTRDHRTESNLAFVVWKVSFSVGFTS